MGIAEQKRLSPNIMTFGVLALGCQNYKDTREFLEGMEICGYIPNAVIMSTLIDTACHKKDLHYLLFVMDYMVKNKMRPNAEAVKNLEEFSKGLSKIEKPTVSLKMRRNDFYLCLIIKKIYTIFYTFKIFFFIGKIQTSKNEKFGRKHEKI